MTKITVMRQNGITQPCLNPKCFHWVFEKTDGHVACDRCGEPRPLRDGEVEGQYPRAGQEFSDRMGNLPRYSFWYKDGGGVLRVPDTTGKWFEADDATVLMEEAQNEINTLRARLAQYEPQGKPSNE